MALTFLNPSRSYDADHDSVRFVGYDGMTSVPFSVEVRALRKAGAGSPHGEVQALAAFDAVRKSIHDVAQEAYANARQTTYVLTARDFR